MPDENAQKPREVAALEALPATLAKLKTELRRGIVGQDRAIELCLVALCAQRHALLVGVPGLAKTTLVRALARLVGCSFTRVQFTPDLMPGDVTGSEILRPSPGADPSRPQYELEFQPGPIFGNLVLADEINRAPPRTQAALLEAMAERQVTAGGRTHPLPDPFVVIATQNPIEQDGTYPLPEAQLDRFALRVTLDYPSAAEERRIVAETEAFELAAKAATPVFSAEDLRVTRDAIARVPLGQDAVDTAVRLTRATRPGDDACPRGVRGYVRWGAGPRAAQELARVARCLAVFAGEPAPRGEHVRAAAEPVLAHRLVLNESAAADGIDASAIVSRVLDAVAED